MNLRRLMLHDSLLIVSGLGNKTAWIWDMNMCELKVLLIDDKPNIDAGVMSVAISPDTHFIAAVLLDTVVHVWDIAMGMLIDCLHRHSD
jgi:WD40 repeat protein